MSLNNEQFAENDLGNISPLLPFCLQEHTEQINIDLPTLISNIQEHEENSNSYKIYANPPDLNNKESDEDERVPLKPNNAPRTSVVKWNSDQIMKWILDLYDKAKYRYEDLSLHFFKKRDGMFLISLTESDWKHIDKNRSKWLYENVQKLVQLSKENYSENWVSSDQRASSSSDEEATHVPVKRKRGRPRSLVAKRRQNHKIGRVWEFLRNLLLNPEYCPRLIYWEDYSSRKFRLVDGSAVAKLWGDKKNNPNMNYEKFSRSIRHYYKYHVIESVPKENLVYKFGKNAFGVETDNPNFGFQVS